MYFFGLMRTAWRVGAPGARAQGTAEVIRGGPLAAVIAFYCGSRQSVLPRALMEA